jgi:hypothetical protein
VLENGVVAGFSANVTQLAYVGGVIYQQNTADAWYNWNGTTWLGIVRNPLPRRRPPPVPALRPVALPQREQEPYGELRRELFGRYFGAALKRVCVLQPSWYTAKRSMFSPDTISSRIILSQANRVFRNTF